jgi:hypothetical protein
MSETLETLASRCKQALAEAGLFLVLLLIHKALDFALGYFYPEFAGAIHAVRLVVFAIFLVGYLNQALEILFTLAPWSRTILTRVVGRWGTWLLAKAEQAAQPTVPREGGARDVEGGR